MKKLILILFCMVFLIGTVSAIDIDDVKYYDEGTKTYTLENFFGLGKHIADLELKTPQVFEVARGYRRVAMVEIRNGEYDYNEIINGIKLYNINEGMKETVRTVDYKYKKTVPCKINIITTLIKLNNNFSISLSKFFSHLFRDLIVNIFEFNYFDKRLNTMLNFCGGNFMEQFCRQRRLLQEQGLV